MNNLLRIKEILNKWDPIGVVEFGIDDEYDNYVPYINNYLIQNPSQHEVVELLNNILDEIGLTRESTDNEVLNGIANEILKLK